MQRDNLPLVKPDLTEILGWLLFTSIAQTIVC